MKPVQFDEAINQLRNRETKPADWSAATWSEKAPEVRQKAFWISRVENARFLTRAHSLLDAFITREVEEVIGPDGEPTKALKMPSRADFIMRMRDFMIKEGMASSSEFKTVNQKDIRDLRSVARLKLIFDTNIRQAFGYGQWQQGMTPAALRAFPAARLIRDRGVKEPRPRHQDNLGEVLLKTDPRWSEFHNAREIGGFEVPWGPYGFNSGVTQEDVSRREAKALGLPVGKVRPMRKSSTDGLSASIKGMPEDLRRKLIQEIKSGPKPRSAKEAARKAAQDTRRQMLERGLEQAVANGQSAKVRQYRKALEKIPQSDAPQVIEKPGEITLAKLKPEPKPEPKKPSNPKAGSDITPKLAAAPGTPARATEALDRSLRAIEKVHGDGPLKNIKMSKAPWSENTLGQYSTGVKDKSEPAITLFRYDHAEATTVHEIGHWLDHMAFTQKGAAAEGIPFQGYFTIKGRGRNKRWEVIEHKAEKWKRSTYGSHGEEFEGFRKAALASKSIRDIKENSNYTSGFRAYLMREREIWARAYAQWIARESGDEVLLEQINHIITEAKRDGRAPTQWEWDDFELVSDEISAIFKKRGWLRK